MEGDLSQRSFLTLARLVRQLRDAGLVPGETVLVHTSMSALGWICGGPVSVIQALLECVGPQGTIMVPTHSADYSDPSTWVNPPVPKEWWTEIRQQMPAWISHAAPCRGMGSVPECFRKLPGAIRSSHPQVSFAAIGPAARSLTEEQSLYDGLGDDSPLGALYRQDGSILLLGVGHERNTSLHLGEVRAGIGRRIRNGAPLLVDGKRTWVRFDEIELDSEDFPELGRDLERKTTAVRTAPLGDSTVRLMKQRPVVDFATNWIRARRRPAN